MSQTCKVTREGDNVKINGGHIIPLSLMTEGFKAIRTAKDEQDGLASGYNIVKDYVENYNDFADWYESVVNKEHKANIKPSQISTASENKFLADTYAALLNESNWSYKVGKKKVNIISNSAIRLLNKTKRNIIEGGRELNQEEIIEGISDAQKIFENGVEVLKAEELAKAFSKSKGSTIMRGIMASLKSIKPNKLKAHQLETFIELGKKAVDLDSLSQEQKEGLEDDLIALLEDIKGSIKKSGVSTKAQREVIIRQIIREAKNISPELFELPTDFLFVNGIVEFSKDELDYLTYDELVDLRKAITLGLKSGFVPGFISSLYNKVKSKIKTNSELRNDSEKFNDVKAVIDLIKDKKKTGTYYSRITEGVKEFTEKNPNTTINVGDVLVYVQSENPLNWNLRTLLSKTDIDILSNKAEQEMIRLNQTGLRAEDFKLFFSGFIGRATVEQLHTLPAVFELAFKSRKDAAKVMEKIGLNDFRRGIARAKKSHEQMELAYFKEFNKKKPSGLAFNDALNDIERGAIAFLRRTTKDPLARQEEFNRRLELIRQNLNSIKNNTDREVRSLYPIYEKIYDKFKDAKSVEDVEKIADKTNLEAVKWWTAEWAKRKDELFRLSSELYGDHLEDDLNYIPDRYRPHDVELDITNMEGDRFITSDSITYKREGVIEAVNKPTKVHKDYSVDLRFNSNNLRTMHKALTFVNTAEHSVTLKASIDSEYFKGMLTPDVYRILKERVALYQRKARGSYFASRLSPEARKIVSIIQGFSKIAYDYTLGGIFQPVKQYVPMVVDTLIASGGNLSAEDLYLGANFNSDLWKWLERGGVDSIIRGLSSHTQDDKYARTSKSDLIKINKIEKALRAADKGFKGVKDLSELKLRYTLVNADRAINASAMLAHYKNALKKKGKEWKGFDAPIDKEAIAHAQQRVESAQNVSDADLMGKLFSTENAPLKMLTGILIPFMNFAINLKVSMINSSSILLSPNASKEDKKEAASELTARLAGMGAFGIISYWTSILVHEMSMSLFDICKGKEDANGTCPAREKERKRYRDVLKKGRMSALVSDLTPYPLLDIATLNMANSIIEQITGTEDALYTPKIRNASDAYGIYGIAYERLDALFSSYDKARGVLKTKDPFTGKAKEVKLTEDQAQMIQVIGVMNFLSSFGLGIAETKRSTSQIEGFIKYQGKNKGNLPKLPKLPKLPPLPEL